MSSFATLPLVLTNQDFVSMKQLTNSSINNGDYVLSDRDFENYITYHLAQETAPVDLSNDDFTTPNTLNISDSSLDNSNVLISNNDTVLVNENFALKVNYVEQNNIVYDNWNYNIGGDTLINTHVQVYDNTNSIYDSNLKIEVNFNNDSQYTGDNEWAVEFDRSIPLMNYFACINSRLEDICGNSPFYVLENSANIYSLGNNPESVYNEAGSYYGTHTYFTRDVSGIMIPNEITSNSLDSNFCRSQLNIQRDDNGAYVYNNNEFNTFKIIQDQPHVDNSISYSNNGNGDINGPITFNGSDIVSGTFDVSDIFNTSNPDWNSIGDGFQATIYVGSIQDGGYEINPNSFDPNSSGNAFSINDDNLTRDVNNPYLKIKVQNSQHTLDITNGSVYATSNYNTANTDYISIGSEGEYLSQNFYNVSGQIIIYTKDTNNRVYYPDNGGSNSFTDLSGVKSSLTNYVNVYYNDAESNGKSTINGDVQTIDNVRYTVSVVASSTSDVVLSSDKRNLDTDNSALLTLATDNSNINLYDLSFVLDSSLPTDPSYVQIISIENQSILTEDSPLKDLSGSTVSGSTSSVTVQHIDLYGLSYENYRVYLTTKTVADISNLLHLNGGWNVATTDPSYTSMIGNATKTGVIRDDYLFMTNASDGSGEKSGLDISMNYSFQLASEVIANTQAIKHRIAISFNDIQNYKSTDISNTTYDLSQTVFYLDDQDITIIDISGSIVEDASCTNIIQSSLNNGSYIPSNYIFKKFTNIRNFKASFDSKFHFYTNLLFVTPTIYERSVYYQIFDLSGSQLPSYLLKYFQCNDSGNVLSNTYVNLVNSSGNLDSYGNSIVYSTTFDFTQEVASIFNVELYGSTDSINYIPVPNTILSYLDPFFNLKSTINNFDGKNANGTVIVNFGTNNIVNKSQYYIQTDNAPGENLSFNAKRYIYTVGTPDDLLNNFTFYNNFYDNLNGMTTCDVNLEISGNVNILSVSDGTGLLAKISHPTLFINNYNIIVCSSPLIEVTSYYDGYLNDHFYTLANDNTVEVDSGVYYHNTSNPSVGLTDTFGLISDSFSLKFVNSVSFGNNTSYVNQTLFTESNTNTLLRDTNQYAKSVNFALVRGYNSLYNGGLPHTGTTYYDVIRLVRTPSIYTFYLDISGGDLNVNNTTVKQTFTGVYNGQEFTVDNLQRYDIPNNPNPNTYNLGLIINVNESILSDYEINYNEGTSFIINARVADYLSNIGSNPYEPDIIGVLGSGFVTDVQLSGPNTYLQKDLLYPYINGIQAACIKSYGSYQLEITRNVPALRIYSLNTPNYIGDPNTNDTDPSVWNYEGYVNYNNFLWTGYSLSNLNVRRLAAEGINGDSTGHVVFYNSYYSYYVVAPPSISIYGYPTTLAINSVPISGQQSVFFSEFDIITQNEYTYEGFNGDLYFYNENNYPFTHYLYNANSKYYFNIKGNKVKISLYGSGTGNFGSPNSPVTIDNLNGGNNWKEILYDNICIEDLYNTVNLSVSLDENRNYNIDYKQLLQNTHNITPNIYFSVGNAFTGPNNNSLTGSPNYYLRLPTSIGTNVSFYQANIIYVDICGQYNTSGDHIGHYDSSYSYYMIIDKYDTDSNINYNAILEAQTIREYFFPVQTHYTKQIYLGSIEDGSGNIINQDDYLNRIELSDVSNASWVQDNSFNLQYVGITLSGLSTNGVNAIADLLKYDQTAYLESKSLYVKRQDAIRLKNILGNTLFRVTNSGNVQTRRLLTSNVSLYNPSSGVTPNVNSNIAGSSDIITIFVQDTILDN